MVTFSKRGHRKSILQGLHYVSDCGNYSLYKSDRLFGTAVIPVRWLAFRIDLGVSHQISPHPTRKSAEKACQRLDKARSAS